MGLEVEERVEEVESRNPQKHGPADGPRLPGSRPGDSEPGTDRREGETGAEPEVAEPREALQVRIDDEHHNGDGPQPAHDRVELEHGDEEHRERRAAEGEYLHARESSARELARRRAWIARIELGVDESIECHGK